MNCNNSSYLVLTLICFQSLSFQSLILCYPMDCTPPSFSVQGDSPDRNTAVGCRVLLERNFPSQGSNSDLLHCTQILCQQNDQGSPSQLSKISCLIFPAIFLYCVTPHEGDSQWVSFFFIFRVFRLSHVINKKSSQRQKPLF